MHVYAAVQHVAPLEHVIAYRFWIARLPGVQNPRFIHLQTLQSPHVATVNLGSVPQESDRPSGMKVEIDQVPLLKKGEGEASKKNKKNYVRK